MEKTKSFIGITAGLLFSATVASADVLLYQNVTSNQNGGTNISYTGNPNAFLSSNFSITGNSTLTSVTFEVVSYLGDGMFVPATPDQVTRVGWAITSSPLINPYTIYYSGIADINDATPSVNNTIWMSAISSLDSTFSLPANINLASGSYYLSLYGARTSGNADNIFWVNYNNGKSTNPLYNYGDGWFDVGGSYYFSINGTPTVPEPSTYSLIGIGVLAVAFAARRRKAKSV